MQISEPLNSLVPKTTIDRTLVVNQLERLLASPLFSQSRRYPRFLRFAVEEVLAGHADELKERTLGIEVLGWPPDYDANADPAVRIMAGEIRKRIAQYYFQPGREGELRIELPVGSYAPVFRPSELRSQPAPEPKPLPPPEIPVPPRTRLRNWAWPAACVLCLLAGALVSRLQLRDSEPTLHDFWSAVLTPPESVLICVSEPIDLPWNRPVSQDAQIRHYFDQSAGRLSLPNALAMTRVATLLSAAHKNYRVATDQNVTLNDMRRNGVVLIGALNNSWTKQMSGNLRFYFATDAAQSGRYWVSDKQHPTQQSLVYDGRIPYREIQQDYAIIAKFHDQTCDCPVIVAGGIGGYGTLAASEFLSDESSFRQVLSHAPKDWKNRNMEVVLSTQVVNGESGPPHIVDSYFW